MGISSVCLPCTLPCLHPQSYLEEAGATPELNPFLGMPSSGYYCFNRFNATRVKHWCYDRQGQACQEVTQQNITDLIKNLGGCMKVGSHRLCVQGERLPHGQRDPCSARVGA